MRVRVVLGVVRRRRRRMRSGTVGWDWGGLDWIGLDWIGLGVSEWVLSAVSDGLRGGENVRG